MLPQNSANHHDLVRATQAVYAQEGYSILECESHRKRGFDFLAQAVGDQKPVGVRCLVVAGDTAEVGVDLVSEAHSATGENEQAHIVTNGRFSLETTAYAADKNITLVDGYKANAAFSLIPKASSCAIAPNQAVAPTQYTFDEPRRNRFRGALIGFAVGIAAVLAVVYFFGDGDQWRAYQAKNRIHPVPLQIETISPEIRDRARNEAIAIAQMMHEAQSAGSDYVAIAEGDKTEAVRLFFDQIHSVGEQADDEKILEAIKDLRNPDSPLLTQVLEELEVQNGKLLVR